MSKTAKAAEEMWQQILTEAGFSDERRRFTRDYLYSLAQQNRPGTIKLVNYRFAERGWELDWNLVQPKFILDHCFAIDSLTDPLGMDKLFSFDVTTNPHKVGIKEEAFARLQSVYRTLSVVKSAVILIVWSHGPQSFYSLSEEKQEYLIDYAYRIVTEMSKSDSKVFNFTICI